MDNHLAFQQPFNMIVSAQTQAGKTEVVLKLCKEVDNLIEPASQRIIWCYTEYQDKYDSSNIVFNEELPDIDDIFANKEIPQLLILDDMVDKLVNNNRLFQWFSKVSHHNNLCINLITQSLFMKGLRNSRINSYYIVLLRNPADKLQVMNLGRQLFPGQSKYYLEAFNDAVGNKLYGYLVIDSHPKTLDKYRPKMNIFKDEQPMVFYVPK